jgi:hypothetical protein
VGAGCVFGHGEGVVGRDTDGLQNLAVLLGCVCFLFFVISLFVIFSLFSFSCLPHIDAIMLC